MQYTEQNIHAKNAEVVLKMFTDPAYFMNKYKKVGATQIEQLECRKSEHAFSITTSRQVAVEAPVPAFAKKLVPDQITIIQTDTWDLKSRTGTLDIQFKGIPVTIKCNMALRDQGSECIQDLNFTLKVSVPLIGAKLEQLLADDLRQKFAADAAAARELLKDYS